ncbi:MAG: hypothetical protein MUF19_03280 [Candidatus Pacebacteria bacterium]|jgi:hypothetical protein|nr:hypothetical protein [Candidatus Paceibacterota bacterium]
MDRETLNKFVEKLDGFGSWSSKMQVDYVVYFLTFKHGVESATVADINKCFELLDLGLYSRLPVYLSEETKSGRYIKSIKGYRLQRALLEMIHSQYEAEPKKVLVSQHLTDLVLLITEPNEKQFLLEAINCYRVEAYRSFIVMVWILTVDHLQRFVFANKLTEFNLALNAHSDKKMKPVVSYDDFSSLRESRFIELLANSGIISNDVRKILDVKLGIRNSAGHPSGVKIFGHKATEFVIDLVENVLLKY